MLYQLLPYPFPNTHKTPTPQSHTPTHPPTEAHTRPSHPPTESHTPTHPPPPCRCSCLSCPGDFSAAYGSVPFRRCFECGSAGLNCADCSNDIGCTTCPPGATAHPCAASRLMLTRNC